MGISAGFNNSPTGTRSLSSPARGSEPREEKYPPHHDQKSKWTIFLTRALAGGTNPIFFSLTRAGWTASGSTFHHRTESPEVQQVETFTFNCSYFCVPLPQVTEQGSQVPHGPHLQSRGQSPAPHSLSSSSPAGHPTSPCSSFLARTWVSNSMSGLFCEDIDLNARIAWYWAGSPLWPSGPDTAGVGGGAGDFYLQANHDHDDQQESWRRCWCSPHPAKGLAMARLCSSCSDASGFHWGSSS